jgi:LPXTG-motif cell wall-anchored protein
VITKRTTAASAVAAVTIGLLTIGIPTASHAADPLSVNISFSPSVVADDLQGRVYFLVAPQGADPLDDIWVGGSTMIFGQNLDNVHSGETVTLSGGGDADTGVYGFAQNSRALDSLDDIPAGNYTVRAFFNKYETVTRSDGSTLSLHFPCGDGGDFWQTPGNLLSAAQDVTIGNGPVALTLDQERETPDTSNEIGGCEQGNYADTDRVKYVKIRSTLLSDFWGRDMYVGAVVALPADYDAADTSKRYPVDYVQDHWSGPNSSAWVDDIFTVKIRQESPYYDSAYGVNSANLGPWGDAIADELIPEIDRRFNTIAEPWARATEGGSTGGWVSLASAMFRPDVYGSAWSYYPDPLDFHRHQLIDVYGGTNAYYAADGSEIGSWRGWAGSVTMPQENHYELALGTNSRSNDQWDVWNAVYGAQGYNGYPLDPWNKVTGDIDTVAAVTWRPMDLTNYIETNWGGDKNLSEALKGRLHVSVGTEDDYYLDGGVGLFKQKVEELGGADWAEVSVVPGGHHTGRYNYMSEQDFFNRVRGWMAAHAPDGATPLTAEDTSATTRGNTFAEVLALGGRGAAVARQAAPVIAAPSAPAAGDAITASAGSWDSAVALSGQWLRDGAPVGQPVVVEQTTISAAQVDSSYEVTEADLGHDIRFDVTGSKPGYETETRSSEVVSIAAAPVVIEPVTPTTPATDPATGSPASPVGPTPATAGSDDKNLARTGAEGAPMLLAVGLSALLAGAGAFIAVRRSRRRSRI